MLLCKDFQGFQGACELCNIRQISRTSYVLTFHVQISNAFGSCGNTIFSEAHQAPTLFYLFIYLGPVYMELGGPR